MSEDVCLICHGPCRAEVNLRCACKDGSVRMHVRCALVMTAKTGNKCPVCRRAFSELVDATGNVVLSVDGTDMCNLATSERRIDALANARVFHIFSAASLFVGRSAQQRRVQQPQEAAEQSPVPHVILQMSSYLALGWTCHAMLEGHVFSLSAALWMLTLCLALSMAVVVLSFARQQRQTTAA